MKNISYRGFNSSALTFESEAEFTKGEPVGISTSGACAPAGSGDLFIGICVSVRDNLITAQMEGYVEVPYSSTASPSCCFAIPAPIFLSIIVNISRRWNLIAS